MLFLTCLIGEVAAAAGCSVISSETHGMAMRGGSVISCIRIGPYASPHIPAGRADFMLALSEDEMQLNRHLLNRESGRAFVNTARKKRHCVDASKLALACGSALAANLVMLGFGCPRVLSPRLRRHFADACAPEPRAASPDKPPGVRSRLRGVH